MIPRGVPLVLLALLLSACAASGELARASIDSTRALDVATFAVWQTRGADVGRAAQRYCYAASARERAWMRDALALASAPAVVTITCPALSE